MRGVTPTGGESYRASDTARGVLFLVLLAQKDQAVNQPFFGTAASSRFFVRWRILVTPSTEITVVKGHNMRRPNLSICTVAKDCRRRSSEAEYATGQRLV